MTWTLKLRGDPTGTIIHDYLCPVHGRFEAEVSRADVPDVMPCPRHEGKLVPATQFLSLAEAERIRSSLGAVCGAASPWSPSGITSRVKPGEVVRGKVETNGLPADVCMSTQALADGMPLAEFKAKRAKLHADLAIKKMRQLTGRTGKAWSR